MNSHSGCLVDILFCYFGLTLHVVLANTGSGTASTDNATSWGTSGMTMISCRQFSCNYSDCNDVYMNMTSVTCNANITFCELKRQEDMTYTGGCSSSCSNACVNDTQTNCSMGCCNSTGCLSSTLASMVRTNTTTVMMTTTTATTTAAATTTTTAEPTNKLKKCQMFQCTEQNCYKTWITKDPMPCPLNQPYCELKKMTTGSTTTWMGGCNANCTRNTWCTTTTDTCHQECCNTSMTSCLKLDGTLNVPSSAARGPHFPLALVTAALLVCLLSIGSLGQVIKCLSRDISIGADTRVRLNFQDGDLEVRLPFGSHSRLFLSEVNKAWSDVCKSPKEAPKFEWLHKYRKASKGQGGVKQTLAPLGTTHTKISQHKETGACLLRECSRSQGKLLSIIKLIL
ncbi:unnamed protein product [Oncorhynchus mykiss]|uniref:INPP5B PH domain-containing protein n=1 Tax=Oncorhynchus mykiss TaxID=8022 RepID=A0A060VZH8_ONCMY|nr:unnamed protein product [Oncorhynchus mykiss]